MQDLRGPACMKNRIITFFDSSATKIFGRMEAFALVQYLKGGMDDSPSTPVTAGCSDALVTSKSSTAPPSQLQSEGKGVDVGKSRCVVCAPTSSGTG